MHPYTVCSPSLTSLHYLREDFDSFYLILNYLLILLGVSVPNMLTVNRGRCGAIGRFLGDFV